MASGGDGAGGHGRRASPFASHELVARAVTGVSAIVVSYFTGPTLADCLTRLGAETAVQEIILVDNGNEDGAVAAAVALVREQAAMPVKLISGHGNIGFAAACNKGAKEACGDYLLLINPDAVIASGGVARMIEASAGLVRPWLMGPDLRNFDGTLQRGARRGVLTPVSAIGEATGLGQLGLLPRFNLHNDPLPDGLCETPTLSGACLFLCKDDYAAISGMDDAYFLHVEDIDFCKRFRDAGGRVWFNPHVTVRHVKGSSTAPASTVEAYKTRGLIRFFNVHFKKTWPAPARLILAGLLWASYAMKIALRTVLMRS